jgi:hypothetical protein
MDTIERTIVGLIVLLAVLAAGTYVFTHMPQTAYVPGYNYAASPGYLYAQPQPTTTYSYRNYPTTTSTSSSASNYTTYPLPPQTTYTVTDQQF